MRSSDRAEASVSFTQAMLAFGHYMTYSKIASELEKKCYDAALTDAKEMRNLQITLLADNLRASGNNQDLVDYVRLRDPDLLKAIQSGRVPEPRSYTTTCP
jgi:hypothetical protein